ncbi:hypothetical protein OG979_25980 [Actinomadura citrea]|nr:hypothetical protein [Actinomadura citrea]
MTSARRNCSGEPGYLWPYAVLLLLAGLALIAMDRWRTSLVEGERSTTD